MLSEDIVSGQAVSVKSGWVAVVGAPSPMMAWVVCLVQHVARASEGQVRILELRQDLQLDESSAVLNILVGHESAIIEPDVAARQMRTIAVLDDLDVAIEFLRGHGVPLIDALRLNSAALAYAPALRENPKALVLTRDRERAAIDVVDAILRQLGVELSPHEMKEAYGWLNLDLARNPSFETALATYCKAYGLTEPDPGNLSPAINACILSVLVPMRRLASQGPWPPIVWPLDVLSAPGKDEEQPPVVMELAGPPRCILFGPYFHLPRGRYEVQFVLGVTEDAGGMRFAIELHDIECVGRAEVKLKDHGTFRGKFYYEQRKPAARLSMRLLSEESAIEGRLGFGYISFLSVDES